MREDVEGGTKWRAISWRAKGLTPTIVGKIALKCFVVVVVVSFVVFLSFLFLLENSILLLS